MTLDDLTGFILKATQKPAKFLVRDYFELDQLRQVSTNDRNIYNFIDHAIDRTKDMLLANLEKYPNSKVVFNDCKAELNVVFDNDAVFYVFPIEGVDNLVHAVPMFGIIVVVKVKNALKSCIINFPLLNEIYYASYKQGAWLERTRNNSSNISRIKVSKFSSYNTTIYIDKISTCCDKIGINAKHINTYNLKIQASLAHSFCAVSQNKADILVIDNPDHVLTLAMKLFANEVGIHYQQYNNYFVVSNNPEIQVASVS